VLIDGRAARTLMHCYKLSALGAVELLREMRNTRSVQAVAKSWPILSTAGTGDDTSRPAPPFSDCEDAFEG
jgi:hypothetical protein